MKEEENLIEGEEERFYLERVETFDKRVEAVRLLVGVCVCVCVRGAELAAR